MSNLEHLFENAIDALDHNKTYDEWVESETNLNIHRVLPFGDAVLSDGHTTNLRDIWSLANYVVYTHDAFIVSQYR